MRRRARTRPREAFHTAGWRRRSASAGPVGFEAEAVIGRAHADSRDQDAHGSGGERGRPEYGTRSSGRQRDARPNPRAPTHSAAAGPTTPRRRSRAAGFGTAGPSGGGAALTRRRRAEQQPRGQDRRAPRERRDAAAARRQDRGERQRGKNRRAGGDQEGRRKRTAEEPARGPPAMAERKGPDGGAARPDGTLVPPPPPAPAPVATTDATGVAATHRVADDGAAWNDGGLVLVRPLLAVLPNPPWHLTLDGLGSRRGGAW